LHRRARKAAGDSPISHPIFVDLAFEHDRTAGQYRREQRHASIPHLALPRGIFEALEEPAVAIEDFGTTPGGVRRHVVGRNETVESALEIVGRKARLQQNFALDSFQGV